MTAPPWHQACMTAFDTETTSPLPEEARIVTASVVRICNAQVESREWLLNPGIEIPEPAAAIHGITTAVARDKGTDPAEGVAEIADELYQAWDRDEPVIIANATYDLTVLDREMRRLNGVGVQVLGVVIDPMRIDKTLDKYRPGKRTLTDLCKTYNVKIEGAHGATADALAAARVTWRLAQKWPEYLARLEDLNEMQARWQAEWAADFVAYRQRRGDPVDDVRHDWPLVPYQAAS